MKRRVLWISVVTILIAAPVLAAPAENGNQPSVEELLKKIEQLEARITELETQDNQPPATGSFQTAPFPKRLGGGKSFFSHDPFDWDPFAEMDRMHQRMQMMFQGSSGGPSGAPAGSNMFSQTFSMGQNVEFKEVGRNYVLTIDMKDMDQDKFHLDIKPDYITISGEQSRQDKRDGQGTYFESSSFGSFVQTIPLPVDADTSKVKTEKQGDSLVVTIPKK